ncbi:MAG: sortase [Bacilli bacterium]|nr:sortase [Bacilli bacterium]
MLKLKYFLTIIFILSIILLLLNKSFINKTIIKNISIYDENINQENYLYIPAINLKNTIYEINDNKNNVDYNVELISNDTNHFILAGHSGIGKTAYFNDLCKLNKGDLIYFLYNNIYYSYYINEIYEIEKNGYFEIKKYNTKVINLITCKNNVNNIQVVYVGFLKESI